MAIWLYIKIRKQTIKNTMTRRSKLVFKVSRHLDIKCRLIEDQEKKMTEELLQGHTTSRKNKSRRPKTQTKRKNANLSASRHSSEIEKITQTNHTTAGKKKDAVTGSQGTCAITEQVSSTQTITANPVTQTRTADGCP